MYSFLKAFLVLMKLLSLSQFYAPKNIRILQWFWSLLACSSMINSFIICCLPVQWHSRITRATQVRRLGSKPGRVIPKAWKTILAACTISCSVLMDGCKEKVRTVFTTDVAAWPTAQSERTWAPADHSWHSKRLNKASMMDFFLVGVLQIK